ncbi:hypothetical protein L208DRAFT_1408491 [Tricholoma matsutake]|nr:hypothetical protein L208DRAFT_1408491 [Tricholoma matsutake 945]
MFRATVSRLPVRAFSTSAPRAVDLAKLVLIGRLAVDPQVRQTKSSKEFVTYTVATQNYPPPPPDANGERPRPTTTFHRVLSFNDYSNRYLQTLQKGSTVYVEAGFELREPDRDADPTTPQGQRQIYLKHETIRLIRGPYIKPEEQHEEQHEE